MKTMLGLADQEEAEGEGLLVGKLGMMAISDGGTYWAALFHQVFPALVLGQPVHRVTPFEEASALATLIHEVVGKASLLAFTDGPNGFCAECAADGFAGGRQAVRQVAVTAEALEYIVGEAMVCCAAA